MKLLLALIILLNSIGAFAVAPVCETASELMSSNFEGKEFTTICEKIVSEDKGCQRLKPEKRMNCNSKASNEILSSKDLASKIGQCIKGFLWDSMVDLVKFVKDLISAMVGAQETSMRGIYKFLSDSDYREKALLRASNNASAGWKLGKAFLNSASLYFAREFPRNLKMYPFDPMQALGRTLMQPLVDLMTNAVKEIAAYYIPQFTCMNGTAKLYTICKTMGDFIMPPVFVLGFIKSGINGLRALKVGSEAAKIAKVERSFAEANEIRVVASTVKKASEVKPTKNAVIVVSGSTPKTIPKTPAQIHPIKPRQPIALTKPIEKHTDDELIELARSERAKPVATEEKKLPKKEEKLSLEEQKAQLVIDARAEDLISSAKDIPGLILKYSGDPEYATLFKMEKAYPEQNRDLAIVISDMEKKNPKMPKSEVKSEIEKFMNSCGLKR